MNTATLPAAPAATWFGHPKGLAVLFLAEMWERTSYYGMRTLLVLYMVDHLFKRPDADSAVLGLAPLKAVLTLAHGPLQAQALASLVYGLYTAFVYLSPVFGGMLADRVLGRRRTVVVGGLLMAIGHFLMASEALFLPALLFLIVGNGCFKPNLCTQVGALYAPGDPRRDRAYMVYYLGVNLGAFIAPLVCGTLGQMVGWHAGFGAAGVGMLLGLVFYAANQDKLPEEPPPTQPAVTPARGIAAYLLAIAAAIALWLVLLALPAWLQAGLALAALAAAVNWLRGLPGDERPRVLALCVACAVTALFWSVYEQQGNTLQLWADQQTAWPTVLGFTIPSTWYQSFNPFMIFLFVPLLNALWAWQAARGREPSSLAKLAIGCALCGAGFLVMIAGEAVATPGVKQHLLWLTVATAVFTIGELYLSPIGLSFVSKVAPARLLSTLMGVWFLANFFGNYGAGWLGSFYEQMPKSSYFALMTAIGLAGGAVLWVLKRPLQRAIGREV
ncbi:MAG: peptide MFS transporter [Rubrivivax sp.]|nr:peptide MFS transporter [Rubrivivax sp.]